MVSSCYGIYSISVTEILGSGQQARLDMVSVLLAALDGNVLKDMRRLGCVLPRKSDCLSPPYPGDF
jgi:hypothetical protein